MSDIDPLSGAGPITLLLIVAIYYWQGTAFLLAGIGIAGFKIRKRRIGKVLLAFAGLGELMLAGFFVHGAVSDYLVVKRFDEEARQLLAAVDRGEAVAIEQCLFMCQHSEERLKVTGLRQQQSAMLILNKLTSSDPKLNERQIQIAVRAHKVLADASCDSDPTACMNHLSAAVELAQRPALWGQFRFIETKDLPVTGAEITLNIRYLLEQFIARKQGPSTEGEEPTFDCHQELWGYLQDKDADFNPKYVCRDAQEVWANLRKSISSMAGKSPMAYGGKASQP